MQIVPIHTPPSTEPGAARPAAMVGIKVLLICCYLWFKDSGSWERFAVVLAVRSYLYVEYLNTFIS